MARTVRDYLVTFGLYWVAAMDIVGTLAVVSRIGRPRPPIEPSTAVTLIVLNAVTVLIVVTAAVTFR